MTSDPTEIAEIIDELFPRGDQVLELEELDVGMPPGPDQLPNAVVRTSICTDPEVFLCVYNASLREGTAEYIVAGRRHFRGKRCVLVALHVWNAFNSVSHVAIRRALQMFHMSRHLEKIIFSYLEDRRLICEVDGRVMERMIDKGVPQEPVFKLTLWNVIYDRVFSV